MGVLLVSLCVQAAGVLADYRFETLDNGVVADQMQAMPGKVLDDVTLVPGHTGMAAHFSGRGYVQIAAPKSLSFAQGFTLEAWIYPEALGSSRIIDRSTPGTSDSFCLDTHPGDGLRLITPAGTIRAEHVLQANTWAHVMAVYDADGSVLTLYLNGRNVAEQQGIARVNLGGENPICLGADTRGGNRFVGKIDEVRLYDFPLDEAQVALRLAGTAVKAPPALAPLPICYKIGVHVDRKALLARNDVVYLSPALYAHEALPVGNGKLCAVVWNEGGLSLQLNHANDIWYQRASGLVRLSATPSLIEKASNFSERLSLYDGTVRTSCTGAAGSWQATVTALDGADVVAVHVQGKLPGATLTLELSQWRASAKPVVTANAIGFVEDLPVTAAPQFSRKTALLAGADCPVTLGQPATQRDGTQTVTMTLSPKPAADGAVNCTIYLANPVVAPEVDALQRAQALTAEAVTQGWARNATRAAARWSRFWDRSFINLTAKDRAADYMENLWDLHLYWMGCAGEGDYPVKFNGGPFLAHRDLRAWGTSYWYQNTRELYWALPAANHLELCAPLRNFYSGTIATHRRRAKDAFGKRGIVVEETIPISGSSTTINNPYISNYLSPALESGLQLYALCTFARDDAALRQQVYPYLKEAVDFYMDYATLGPDGLYHITPANGSETYWRVADPMSDLAGLRCVIPILQRESQRLGLDAELRPQWEKFLAQLAPLPENAEKTMYAPCIFPAEIPPSDNAAINRVYPPARTSRSITNGFNTENVEIFEVFPFNQAGIGSANYDKALQTYNNRRFKGAQGWDPTSIVAARLGLGEEAGRAIRQHCGSQVGPQGFWESPAGGYWVGGLKNCPFFDSAGVNAMATTEMLLQSYTGTIRVWPAVPAAWNGAFQLRAETGFMVTSERSQEQVRYVLLESLFGDTCRLSNPWTDALRVVSNGKVVLTSAAREVSFPTQKGQAYLIERVAAPVAQMAYAPLAPAANTDVKYLGAAKRKGEDMAQNLSVPRLGITKDGVTRPRLLAAQNRERAAQAINAAVATKAKLPIAGGTLLTAKGNATPAPWLYDGIYGADNTPPLRAEFAWCVLELPAVTPLATLVWSYDRSGQRVDWAERGIPDTITVQISSDGQTWTPAATVPFDRNMTYGQAISLGAGCTAKFVKVQFLAKDGRPISLCCDEMELY
jgi:hypothetical protein